MPAVAEGKKVRIKLGQGLVGHRTRPIPERTQTARRRMDDGTERDVLVKIPAGVEVIGEFSHAPGDEVEWDATEAEKFVAKGIASYVNQVKNN